MGEKITEQEASGFATMDLKQYEKDVQDLASKKSTLIFPNPSEDHALIVLVEILKLSKEVVRVYDSLIGDLTDENPALIHATKSLIERKVTLKYVYDEVKEDSQLYSVLKEFQNNPVYSEFVIVKKADKNFQNYIKHVFQEDMRFTLGDDEMFRIEPRNEGKRSRSAFCSFNRRSICSPLIERFDSQFNVLT